MSKKEVPDKGVFTWGAFTAIMIIVVVFAVLVFVFKIDLNDEPEKRVNENVINATMIDKGFMVDSNGVPIDIEKAKEEEAAIENAESKPEETEKTDVETEPVEKTEVDNTVAE